MTIARGQIQASTLNTSNKSVLWLKEWNQHVTPVGSPKLSKQAEHNANSKCTMPRAPSRGCSLQALMENEVDNCMDVVTVLSRQLFRRAVSEAVVALTPPYSRTTVTSLLGRCWMMTLPLLLPNVDDIVNHRACFVATSKEY
jgi:hypothetical protein